MIVKNLKISMMMVLLVMLILPVFPGTGGGNPFLADEVLAISGGTEPIGNRLIVDIAKKADPAVVNVSSRTKKKTVKREFRGPGKKSDPFRDFYDRFRNPFEDFLEQFPGPRRDRPSRAMGSGFIIDKEGYILTNNHVVEGADEIRVLFRDDKEYDAKVIGTDPKTDLALIKIIPDQGVKKDFPYLELGNSDKLEVGEWVMAVGNPFGLSHTVTAGIVSAKGRNIGAGPYDEFIQTDASINPGNSGGPLLNMKGKVVGINTAIISGNAGGNVGIGFAIPINLAKTILSDLREKGSVTRGWLGVMIQGITPDLADSLGLEKNEGALVGDVIPDSPASHAGFKRGDVITEFNSRKIVKMEELPKAVAGTPPGKTVPVKLLRNGKKKTLQVTIAVLEPKGGKLASLGNPLGAQVQEITPELAQSLNLDDTEGVLVSQVTPGEAADEAGLRRGDIILEVNRKPVRNLQDYKIATDQIRKDKTVLLLIKRDGSTLYVGVKLG